MESTLSAAATLSSMSKTLNSCLHRHLWATRQSQCLRSQLVLRRLVYSELRRSKGLSCDRQSPHWGWSFCAVPVPAGRFRLECRASSAAAASFSSAAYGSGGGGIGGSGGGDGDGASDGGEAKSDAVVGGSEDVSALSPDVIILDVGGMTCGGCAASVKRILESQPQVSSASVNLTTETAIVWPVSEAKVIPNWQKHLGEILAKHLTSCGFKSNLRGQEAIEGDIPS